MVRFGKGIRILGIYDERPEFQNRDAGEVLGMGKTGVMIWGNFEEMLKKFSGQAEMLVTTGEGLYFTKPKNVEEWKNNIKKAIEYGLDIYTMSKIFYGGMTRDLKEFAKTNNVRFVEASDPEGFEKLRDYAMRAVNEGVNTERVLFAGTSMNSGKITAMLAMKNFLEKRGVKVGTVGTEPCSVFVGIDEQVIPEVLPTMRGAHAILGAIKKVEVEKKPDVIFVGSQTGLRASAVDIAEARAGGVVAWQILMGAKPEKIVLCSKWKNLDEIRPHLELIKNSGIETEVVALVINGYQCKKEKLHELIESTERKFGFLCLDVFATPEKLTKLADLISR